jgi:CsoR family transcriptional regulator, copper-sensing transcriptional repressor
MTAVASSTRPQRRSHAGTRHEQEVADRLRRASGQLSGVLRMYEDGRYCIDVLDQLAAVRAACDAVGVLILEDHIRACVREAIEAGAVDEKVDELVSSIRRYLR